ncbi:enoyl-CoA hydratase/isomerase family protein [Tepidibacillus fermentans]|uniref:Ethylmalonyl-CoA decarboxylase n=1 Tax=Tepidibacillus fermentans TaxID=1281767 RepID=A0A4R3KLG5_9BACI|nr:enoyl-CoA hydratase/isomerase family protein [Tepidibacillus fermentans]TCS84430.1 enoyl-CoA hydratase/carnithine racemase [Tepidibacillus fermentans]
MKTIQVEQKKETLIIVLNRPEFRNAVNFEMMDELRKVLDQAKQSSQIKTIIFTGVERSFSSGGDLGQFHQLKSKDEVKPMLEKMGKVITQIVNLGKPTIAYVNGYALGGGAELAMACDFRFISNQAKMGFIQINLGVTSGWGGGTLLLEKLGRTKALSLLLTGDILNNEQILQYEIALKEVSSFDEVLLFADKINSHSLESLQAYIDLANGVRDGRTFVENQKKEIESCSTLWESVEHERAVDEFLQKNK